MGNSSSCRMVMLTLAVAVAGCGGPEAASAEDVATRVSAQAAPGQPTIGMSAPVDQWDLRYDEVSPPGVDGRRLFAELGNDQAKVNLAKQELLAGRLPVLSVKIPNNDWAGAAAGKYDALYIDLANRLQALPGKTVLVVHHEPIGDGSPADFVAMQVHLMPLARPLSNVIVGVILNGFMWSAQAQGYTDAQIDAWAPLRLRQAVEVLAADTYHGGTMTDPGEDAGVKIERMSAWADRMGYVKPLGIGEFNGLTAYAITHACNAMFADSRFMFGNVFNSNENNREGIEWVLTGARLTAFKNCVTASRQ